MKSRMRWERHIPCVEERRSAYRVLVGKLRGKETTCETQA